MTNPFDEGYVYLCWGSQILADIRNVLALRMVDMHHKSEDAFVMKGANFESRIVGGNRVNVGGYAGRLYTAHVECNGVSGTSKLQIIVEDGRV